MGVKLQPAPADPADAEYPYITCNINIRNMLKSRGCDAAHILELIYGMGDSNTHLIHEHDHGDGAGASGSDGGTETADTAGAGPIGAACNRASGPADYDGASDSTDRDGADSIDCDGLSGQADCDGDCTSCSLCTGCTDKPQPPAPLPDEEQQNRNRAELKEALLALFW